MHNSVLSLALFVLKKKNMGNGGVEAGSQTIFWCSFTCGKTLGIGQNCSGEANARMETQDGFHFITFAIVKPWPFLH